MTRPPARTLRRAKDAVNVANSSDEPERKEWRTAAEFLAELASDPEYVAAQKRLEQEMAEQEREFRAAEEPLLADLRRVGVRVATAWDLIEGGREAYSPATADILLEHLWRTYPPGVRAGIARALAAVASHDAWPRVKAAYVAENDESVKEGLATAVVAAAGPEEVDLLVGLALDASNGPSRVLLLSSLAASPEGRAALEALRDDPEVGKEAGRLLDRMRRRGPPRDAAETPRQLLVEAASVSLDLRSLRRFLRELGEAAGLDSACVSKVVQLTRSVEVEETRAIECRSKGGVVRFEVFGDDVDAPDVYILSKPDFADELRAAAEAALERIGDL